MTVSYKQHAESSFVLEVLVLYIYVFHNRPLLRITKNSTILCSVLIQLQRYQTSAILTRSRLPKLSASSEICMTFSKRTVEMKTPYRAREAVAVTPL